MNNRLLIFHETINVQKWFSIQFVISYEKIGIFSPGLKSIEKKIKISNGL